jgi:hypothetical protein
MNKAKCARCGTVIESKSVHDFQQCKCGAIFVDGGDEYQRCGFNKPSDILLWDGEEFKPWNDEKLSFDYLKEVQQMCEEPETKKRIKELDAINHSSRDYAKKNKNVKLRKSTLIRKKGE